METNLMFEKTPEGYFRVNLHWKSTVKLKWVSKMISDLVELICIEYHMDPHDNRQEILYPENKDKDHLSKLLKLYMNVDSTPYELDCKASSTGLLFKKDDPIVVEYMLKYSETSNED